MPDSYLITIFRSNMPEYVAANTGAQTSAYHVALPSAPTLVIGMVYTLLTYPSALQLSIGPPLPAAYTYIDPFPFRPYIFKSCRIVCIVYFTSKN